MKYRKKPVVIEAVQYNGSNVCEIEEFVGKRLRQTIVDDCGYQAGATAPIIGLVIETLEGDMVASPLDYIIKGVKGEFYPCKPDVFEQTYEGGEEEEMLTCNKGVVQALYLETLKYAPNLERWKGVKWTLDRLFGSKCLPDEKPKPVKPKFHVGHKVKLKGKGYGFEITAVEKWDDCDEYMYKLAGWKHSYRESDLEPYTEPKEVAKMKPIESKVSVYLATKEEDEEFRQLLHENGFKWNSSALLTDLSLWESDMESAKIHFVYPDKTVTYDGDRTLDTLTFSEFKKRYFGEPDTSHETPVCENHSDNTSQKEVNLNSNCNHRQFIVNYDKPFDNILKDSFCKHNRLHIAAMIEPALINNPNLWEQYGNYYAGPGKETKYSFAKLALEYADALLAECEKGGMK